MRGQQTETDRIAELRDDPQCRQFDAHRCLCAACGRWVHLSGRAHKIFNWRRHKKGCTPLKSRGAIQIIQTRSPGTSSREVNELDDELEGDVSSSYTQSDEGHGGGSFVQQIYDEDQSHARGRPNRLPSISTFSLSSSVDGSTPPLSSSVLSTTSESFVPPRLHHRTLSSSSFASLPPNHDHSHYHHHHHVHRSPKLHRSHHHHHERKQSGHTHDPSSPYSRVQCDSCAGHVDLPEWNAHKRLCRSRSTISLRNPQSFSQSPPHILSMDSYPNLPPLTALPPRGFGALPSSSPKERIDLAPIQLPSPSVGSVSQRPGRRIADLIHHPTDLQPPSPADSQSTTPVPPSSGMRASYFERSSSRERYGWSSPPSTTESYRMRLLDYRSLSPPSPYHSDSGSDGGR